MVGGELFVSRGSLQYSLDGYSVQYPLEGCKFIHEIIILSTAQDNYS